MRDFSRAEEIAQVKVQRPHVVILGAGASLASLPNGDKNGKSLPLMNNFVETLGLSPIHAKPASISKVKTSKTFTTRSTEIPGMTPRDGNWKLRSIIISTH